MIARIDFYIALFGNTIDRFVEAWVAFLARLIGLTMIVGASVVALALGYAVLRYLILPSKLVAMIAAILPFG